MKKLLIIPISILLLTACVSVEAPSPQIEEQKTTQKESNVESSVIPVVPATPANDTVNNTVTKEEIPSDGWEKSGNSDSVTSYTGKEITLKGKVVEQESYGEWKYFFSVSDDSLENLPPELVEKIIKKDFLRYFRVYFNGKDVTNDYAGKEITISTESLGIFSEGNPRLDLKKLP